MSLGQELAPHLPLLRRYARALTGSQAHGDAFVRATLEALPEKHKEAFVLVRFEGMSVADAARILGTSEANVKVRVFRAAEVFREVLSKREGGR